MDGYQAAESAPGGWPGTATPKARDGAVESLRVLRVERPTAMRARGAVMHQVRSFLVSAPEPLCANYRGLTSAALMAVLEKTRPASGRSEPLPASGAALKGLAVRCRALHEELALTDAELDEIITARAPMLRDLHGVGAEVATQLLVTAGDNPKRMRTEAHFAA